MIPRVYVGVNPKIIGFSPKMDDANTGSPYENSMDLGVKQTIFLG